MDPHTKGEEVLSTTTLPVELSQAAAVIERLTNQKPLQAGLLNDKKQDMAKK